MSVYKYQAKISSPQSTEGHYTQRLTQVIGNHFHHSLGPLHKFTDFPVHGETDGIVFLCNVRNECQSNVPRGKSVQLIKTCKSIL